MANTKRKSTERETRINKKLKRRGPRLPSRLLKELNGLNPNNVAAASDSGSEDGDDVTDFYEYEEGLAEEEAAKNRRFDPVENLEYQLPEDFEDESVSSDEELGNVGAGDDDSGGDEDEDENEDEEGDGDDKHAMMLSRVTGIPVEAFQGKKNNSNAVISEAYPESEFNPSRDVLDGRGRISIDDLMGSLDGKSGYSKLKKRINNMDRKAPTMQAPLHKAEKDRLERKAASEQSNKDLNKWEPLIKRNREAPTMIFDNDRNIGFNTIGAIAAGFEPRTEFEKKMASITNDEKIRKAYREDGFKLLELNMVSAKDEKDRRNRMAKLRSLLFCHELKAKRIKKIKSKAFHRLLKKDRLKEAPSEDQMDPEAAKELARKHEYERAKERMTLRHKGSSKWAKRIKERGLNAQDEGTRAAIAEQQNIHASLVRKMRSVGDSSSDSDDSDGGNESEDNSSGSEQGRASKLRVGAQEKIRKVLNEDDEAPNSGLLSLPFMVRGMKKLSETAAEEGKLAMEELEGSNGAESLKAGTSKGRMVFNAAEKKSLKPTKTILERKVKTNRVYDDSDVEDDFEAGNSDHDGDDGSNDLQKDATLRDVSEVHHEGLFKSFEEIVKDPAPKTTHEVAIFASGAWKKLKGENIRDASNKKPVVSKGPPSRNKEIKETAEDLTDDSESDSEGLMVDGSSHPKASYELPSQAELIHQAFAGDDVEDEFVKHKQAVVNDENPEPDKPVLLPGWGQWASVQKKKGLPSWMVKEHETAKKKREAAINKRKDARLKHVVISEKVDKRTEKLFAKTLPFPYTSKEVFEQSMRMPLGPEFNPASTFSALNRPAVIKKAGQIIQPIRFEEVNPHDYGKPQRHGKSVPNVNQNKKQKRKENKKNRNDS